MWLRKKMLARRRLDRRYATLPPIDRFSAPGRGWVRAIRDALGMTGTQLASRMGITPPSLSALERSETRGTIRMSTLRKAAAALDCDLVYAIIPRQPLEESIRNRARALALRQLGDVARTMELEAQGVTDESVEDRVADYIRDNIRESDLWGEN
ncbi:MAG: mobile mystery protein A [Alphaproteobacteria bacterium]